MMFQRTVKMLFSGGAGASSVQPRIWGGKLGFLVESDSKLMFQSAQGGSLHVSMQSASTSTGGGGEDVLDLVQIRVADGTGMIVHAGPRVLLPVAAEEYKRWRGRLLRMTGRVPFWRKTAVAAAGLLLLVLLIPLDRAPRAGAAAVVEGAAQPAPAAAEAQAPVAQVAPSGAAPAPAPRLNDSVMAAFGAQRAISFGTPAANGKPFYVFSSTTCEACQQLDSQLPQIAQHFVPKILPVGFDPVAREQAAAAYCAANPQQALHDAMIGLSDGAKPCQAGYDAVDANNKLFVQLGLHSTPTLVTDTGYVGVGSNTADKLTAWLGENS